MARYRLWETHAENGRLPVDINFLPSSLHYHKSTAEHIRDCTYAPTNAYTLGHACVPTDARSYLRARVPSVTGSCLSAYAPAGTGSYPTAPTPYAADASSYPSAYAPAGTGSYPSADALAGTGSYPSAYAPADARSYPSAHAPAGTGSYPSAHAPADARSYPSADAPADARSYPDAYAPTDTRSHPHPYSPTLPVPTPTPTPIPTLSVEKVLEEIILEELQFSDRLHCVPESLASEFAGILSIDVGDAYNPGRGSFYRNSAGFKEPPLRQVYGKGPVHSLVLWDIGPGECWDPAENSEAFPPALLQQAVNAHLSAEYEKGLRAKIGDIGNCDVAGAGVWEELKKTRRNVHLYISLAFYCEGADTLDDHLVNPIPPQPETVIKPAKPAEVTEVSEEVTEDDDQGETVTTVLIEFTCTGSMNPTITCLDRATELRTFTPDDIEVGTIIVFPRGDTAVAHRVVEVTGEGEQEEYTTKGDSASYPDKLQVGYSTVLGIVTVIHKGAASYRQEEYDAARPINLALQNAERELFSAERELGRLLQSYRTLFELHCGYAPDKDAPRCLLEEGPYQEVNGAFQTYDAHYDNVYTPAFDSYKEAWDRYNEYHD